MPCDMASHIHGYRKPRNMCRVFLNVDGKRCHFPAEPLRPDTRVIDFFVNGALKSCVTLLRVAFVDRPAKRFF